MSVRASVAIVAAFAFVAATLLTATPSSAEVRCEYLRSDQTVEVHLERQRVWWMRLADRGEIRMYGPRIRIDCGRATVSNTRRVVVHGGAFGATFGLDNRGSGGPFPSSISIEVVKAAGLAIDGSVDPDRYVVHRDWIDTGGATVRFPRSANVFISGGPGNDLIDARAKATGFMRIRGGLDDDRLLGGRGHDGIEGGRGDDTLISAPHGHGADAKDYLWGGGGDDVLSGGEGPDVLDGGQGSDQLRGGTGKDSSTWVHEFGAVAVDVPTGTVVGAEDTDTVHTVEDFRLTSYGDIFKGGSRDEIVRGNFGADSIMGEQGDDRLIGAQGDDDLDGGLGDDSIHGNQGNDAADGNEGIDICAAETITDCEG
jgi:hypothetical protein